MVFFRKVFKKIFTSTKREPINLFIEPNSSVESAAHSTGSDSTVTDAKKRLFLKTLTFVGLGVFGASLFPKKASALVMGGTPSTSVVGVKDSSNVRVNPATEDTLVASIAGQAVLRKTISLTNSGAVHTPASGKSVRVYNSKFSLSADMTSVSFRFGAGGTDMDIYLSPKAGGLYGTNNQPNYVQGGVNQAFYCAISGTGTVQVNLDYLEI